MQRSRNAFQGFFWGGGEAARVPRLSGSLAGLRLWLGRGLMAGKEGRVYRGLAAEGPNRSEKRKRPRFFFFPSLCTDKTCRQK